MNFTSPREIRVLIADDHAVVRRGLKELLEETPGIRLAAETAGGDELLAVLGRTPCDVVVLDLSMPGPGGLEVLKSVRRAHPKLAVLIFSVHPEEEYAVRAIRDGAAGYLTKEAPFDELIEAIRKVADGGKYIRPSVAERLAMEIESGGPKAPHERLSNREFEVLKMIASGKTVSQIAGELSLSVNTISTLRARILEKMNLENNAQLIRYALDHKLVE